MKSARILLFCFVCLTVAFTATPAQCTTLPAPYTTLSSWDAVVSSPTDIMFGQTTVSAGTDTYDLIQFTGPDMKLYSPSEGPYYAFTTGDPAPVGFLGVDSAGSPVLTITIPQSLDVTAFAVDLMSESYDGPYTITVTTTSGTTAYASSSTEPAPVDPIPVFFGATFTAPVTQIQLSMTPLTGETELIDDFEFGQSATDDPPVPEAATMLMIGTGLLGVAWKRRRAS